MLTYDEIMLTPYLFVLSEDIRYNTYNWLKANMNTFDMYSWSLYDILFPLTDEDTTIKRILQNSLRIKQNVADKQLEMINSFIVELTKWCYDTYKIKIVHNFDEQLHNNITNMSTPISSKNDIINAS